MRLPSILILLATGCVLSHAERDSDTLQNGEPDPSEAGFVDFESAPPEAERLAADRAEEIATKIDTWFQNGNGTRRMYVQLDRPLYKPGETVWIKSWAVNTRAFQAAPDTGVTYELVNPQGAVVQTKQVFQQKGAATNDFVLPGAAPGGQWTLRARTPWGEVDERPFIVASYEAPRIRKDLEFVREAYSAGDTVSALLELERATGGPLADHPVRVLLQVDGETVMESKTATDDTGAAMVTGELPARLKSGDGLLTVLVEDGGITESISRSVPIVMDDVSLELFPEGGDLVVGLPARVYFEGTNRHGEPADVEGYVVDDRGERVADFRSLHDGMGRFGFTPQAGRRYTAHITAPDVEASFVLPEARSTGCTLRSYDDIESQFEAVRVGVRCAPAADVLVTGVLREQLLDSGQIHAGPDEDAVIHLAPERARRDEQGAVRVTVFDEDEHPLAERLVYRNAGRDLDVDITADKDRYGPRDQVTLKVATTDASGDPVPAELALSVVDDTVLSFADDEEGHMLTRLYLEPELVDSPKDPGFYYDDEEVLAARGLDLVMGTRGYRRFEWAPVFDPRPVVDGVENEEIAEVASRSGPRLIPQLLEKKGKVPMRAAQPPMAQPVPDMPAPPMGAAMPEAEPMAGAVADLDMAAVPQRQARRPADRNRLEAKRERRAAEDELMLDQLGYIGGDWGGGGRGQARHAGYSPVRVFPTPDYSAGFQGTRSDFRDTIHWAPKVQTDEDGLAEVSFYLSDAVTTFRATAEGLGDGSAGHGEATIESVLPVSLETKIPAAVSAGDRLILPVTVSSSRPESMDVSVVGSFGSDLIEAHEAEGTLSLDADGKATHWIPLDIGQGNTSATVSLVAEGGGLSDTVERSIDIVPAGFPRSWGAAGELDREKRFTFELDDVVDDSLVATVTWHPSPVSTLIEGMEGMIRTPGGCFEQTSSTNWPNVAILSYLEAHDGDPRLRMESSQMLDVGYGKLTGYQVGSGGFETWGSGPGKEALSAFGLLQFQDMSEVYPVADKILSRDAKYLLSQRDGKGGYKKTGESAHGYGSAPADVLNGFITYALVQTGHQAKLSTELDHQADVARSTDDPYVLALAASSLGLAEHDAADTAMERLVELQAEDGSFPGAKSSITRSYEANLLVESTALANLALMEADGYRTESDAAADWLVNNRQGAGTWGATQATALALNALTTYASYSARPKSSGTLILDVNGETAGRIEYGADQSEALEIGHWERLLKPGKNEIVLRHEDGEPMPFNIDVSWKALNPKTDPGAELTLATTLDRDEARMGDTVRLSAEIRNQAGRVVPSPIARIGLPAGLEAQTWQLKQLQERGEIAFFETRPREVTLYWDGIHTDEVHEVDLDLVATVPGAFTGPASSAYPYYNDDEKAWDEGLKVSIGRPQKK